MLARDIINAVNEAPFGSSQMYQAKLLQDVFLEITRNGFKDTPLVNSVDVGVNPNGLFLFPNLVFNSTIGQVTITGDGGRIVQLSITENKCMILLCKARGRAVTSEAFANNIWEGGSDLNRVNRDLVRKHISQMRKKLERPEDKKMKTYKIIQTVSRFGYRLAVT